MWGVVHFNREEDLQNQEGPLQIICAQDCLKANQPNLTCTKQISLLTLDHKLYDNKDTL